MRARTRARLSWFVIGLVVGWVGSTLQAALRLWPFHENFFLMWIRWAGKNTIKYSFIALVVSVVLFVVIQLLNYFVFAREIHREEEKPH